MRKNWGKIIGISLFAAVMLWLVLHVPLMP